MKMALHIRNDDGETPLEMALSENEYRDDGSEIVEFLCSVSSIIY